MCGGQNFPQVLRTLWFEIRFYLDLFPQVKLVLPFVIKILYCRANFPGSPHGRSFNKPVSVA